MYNIYIRRRLERAASLTTNFYQTLDVFDEKKSFFYMGACVPTGGQSQRVNTHDICIEESPYVEMNLL